MNKQNQELLINLIHPDLKAAMIELGCYRMACDNMKAFYSDCDAPEKMIKDQIQNYQNLFIYVGDCFCSHDTPQGFDYWETISSSIDFKV